MTLGTQPWNEEVERWAEDYNGDCSSYVNDLLSRTRLSTGLDQVNARVILYNLHRISREAMGPGGGQEAVG